MESWRGLGQPEQARAAIPDRRENIAEPNRVPGWLQTRAAWWWWWRRLLLLLLVALAAKGWVAAVILLGVLIIEDQPGSARAATARSSPRRPVRCDSARMSRYSHRACHQ